MAGRLQNEDFKTLSELTGAGGATNQLLNDTKIYITNAALAAQLSSLITSGDVLTSASLLKLGISTDSTTTGTAAALPAATKGILRLTNASLVSISTITGQAAGQYFVLINRTGNSITINDNDAANGIRTGTGAAMTVANNASVVIAYDSTSARSQVIGGSGSSITTPVSIANGGTGQTTQTAAFNALSPQTTKGDLISNDGTNDIRVPVGTTGQYLIADSAATEGVRWADPSLARKYILNGDAENGTVGWTTYADAAGSAPVDGTGGAPNVSWTRSGSSPLRGTGSYVISKDAANRQGQGASYDFTIEAADKAKVMQITFDYMVSSGTFVAGNPSDRTSAGDSDLTIWIYDVTNGVLIQPSTYRLFSNSSTIASQFVSNFQTASNSTSYRIIFHCGSTSAAAYAIKFDNINVLPTTYVYGTPITDWTSYTPTGGWTTNSTYVGKWRRVGDVMEIEAKVSLSGAPNAANCTFNLPSGYTIDTTKMDLVSTTPLGQVNINKNATNSFIIGFAYYNNTTSVATRYIRLSGSIYDAPNVDATTPFSFTTNDTVQAVFSVPITGWSSSVQMSDSADTRICAVNVSGDSASATAGNPIIFPTADFDTHGAYSVSTGKFTAPVAGIYKISGYISSANAAVQLTAYINAVSNRRAGFTDSNGEAVFTANVKLNAGDTLDIRPDATLDANANSVMSIERISGPSAIAATEAVNARYSTAAGQSIAASSIVIVDFGTKTFDTHSAVTTGSSWKFTAPTSGKYAVKCSIRMSASNTTGGTFLYLYKNGSAVSANAWTNQQATNNVLAFPVLVDTIQLNAGDFIDFRINHANAGSLSILNDATYNFVAIEKIGG